MASRFLSSFGCGFLAIGLNLSLSKKKKSQSICLSVCLSTMLLSLCLRFSSKWHSETQHGKRMPLFPLLSSCFITPSFLSSSSPNSFPLLHFPSTILIFDLLCVPRPWIPLPVSSSTSFSPCTISSSLAPCCHSLFLFPVLPLPFMDHNLWNQLDPVSGGLLPLSCGRFNLLLHKDPWVRVQPPPPLPLWVGFALWGGGGVCDRWSSGTPKTLLNPRPQQNHKCAVDLF